MARLIEGGTASAAGLTALLIVMSCAPATFANSTKAGASTPAGARPVIVPQPVPPVSPEVFDDVLTTDKIRALVLKADRFVGAHVYELFMRSGDDDQIGRCQSGRPATRLTKLSDLRAALAKYFTGPALSCYQVSNFGETFGEWIGSCLGDSTGTEFWPTEKSEVRILHRSRDRVVADVSEPGTVVQEGEAEPPYSGFETKSRYTFVREPRGGWLIFERVPNHERAKCPWDGAVSK